MIYLKYHETSGYTSCFYWAFFQMKWRHSCFYYSTETLKQFSMKSGQWWLKMPPPKNVQKTPPGVAEPIAHPTSSRYCQTLSNKWAMAQDNSLTEFSVHYLLCMTNSKHCFFDLNFDFICITFRLQFRDSLRMI